MGNGARSHRRNGWRAALSLAAAAALLAVAPAERAGALPILDLLPLAPSQQPAAERGPSGASVRVVAGGSNKPARYRSLPISRRPGAEPRSLTSVELRRLGGLRGKRIEVSGDLQVSVCLKPSPGFRRPRCVGRRYGYDPRVSARLILAGDPDATGGRGTVGLTPRRTLTCTQRQPDRNHHCLLPIRWRKSKLARDRPACLPRRCRVNLVASANHPRASRRHRVVVGGTDKGGKPKSRGKLRVVAAAHRRQREPRLQRTRERLRRQLPVSAVGKAPPMRAVYSVRIDDPRPGETVLIEGRYAGPLGELPHNARTRTRLIAAAGPHVARVGRPGKGGRSAVRLSAETNFNCTHGPSGHRTPCAIRKTGALRFGKQVQGPVFVNLLAGHGAIGPGAETRWRRGSTISPGAGGWLEVRRYRP